MVHLLEFVDAINLNHEIASATLRVFIDAINLNHEIASATLRVKDGRLYRCYIDLKKAYDKVSRPALWVLLARLGFPPTLIALVKSLH